MPKKKGSIALPLDKDEIIKDYRLAYQSRQASLIGRREVLSGKAKFGIFGDGKEIIQLAIARAFHKGDWRSGYYRDQTWMFMLNMTSIQEFFAQLHPFLQLRGGGPDYSVGKRVVKFLLAADTEKIDLRHLQLPAFDLERDFFHQR